MLKPKPYFRKGQPSFDAAQKAWQTYEAEMNDEWGEDEMFIDLIADLLHVAFARGFNAEEIGQTARMHFIREREDARLQRI